ncbi:MULTISPECIES: DUF1214 domain-containing protein [unclassified Sphingopyxis]|uniref:DUF1214 domain-containing protein n=1 Tax=unclassified Sphingopyxis TaxID=2614943 RepID=UPI00285F5F48|nr:MULTISPECIES: DUF1214 domain-containing protein [unclassified Sphingopyxis]MDR6831886.1 hypothetical protein [Sphingopyxis sp. BE122]MDR7227628.1 hypothetical protein [Sphingopyxis sp. BE259]
MMKSWHRYTITAVGGLVLGLGAAWALTSGGLGDGAIRNGPWTTSLGYGTKATDPLTRAMVARSGLLALPAKETVYWSAKTDAAGAPLDGNCRYRLSGQPLDARWWSVTIYDAKGYLVANPANIWSVNGANVALDAKGEWRVVIAPTKPADAAWLPGIKGQALHLTLRMYNPGQAFRADPAAAQLPKIVREGC